MTPSFFSLSPPNCRSLSRIAWMQSLGWAPPPLILISSYLSLEQKCLGSTSSNFRMDWSLSRLAEPVLHLPGYSCYRRDLQAKSLYLVQAAASGPSWVLDYAVSLCSQLDVLTKMMRWPSWAKPNCAWISPRWFFFIKSESKRHCLCVCFWGNGKLY